MGSLSSRDDHRAYFLANPFQHKCHCDGNHKHENKEAAALPPTGSDEIDRQRNDRQGDHAGVHEATCTILHLVLVLVIPPVDRRDRHEHLRHREIAVRLDAAGHEELQDRAEEGNRCENREGVGLGGSWHCFRRGHPFSSACPDAAACTSNLPYLTHSPAASSCKNCSTATSSRRSAPPGTARRAGFARGSTARGAVSPCR